MANVVTLPRSTAITPRTEWWTDRNMVSLVKRTAFRDCNTDEFDEAVAVARELRLNPLRKQIYAFVFSKESAEKRNMVLVVGVDGARAIAARTGDYRPDNRGPRFIIDDSAKNADVNPLGLVKAEVSIFVHSHGEWHEVVGEAYWDEFAPITKSAAEDEYEWIDTGETWPDSGKPKKKKRLRQGAEVKVQLDPKKDGWRKSARHMLAKCAEMIALRKAFPEDLSRIYGDEEIDRARTIDADYVDLTPSEMASKADADARLERIGGPALLAALDDTGTLERIPFGQFADRVLAVTEAMPADKVAALVERNRVAFQEFWAFNKTDALELKKVLEARSGAVSSATTGPTPAAPAAASPSDAPRREQGEAATSEGRMPAGAEAARLRDRLIADIQQLRSAQDFAVWARDVQTKKATLPAEYEAEVDAEFLRRQGDTFGRKGS